MLYHSPKVIKRFWTKVDKKGEDDCWPWLGTHNKGGYGLFWPERRTTKGAHVYSYELHKGAGVEYPNDVHHTCVNPDCVNPKHLQEITRKENIGHQKKVTKFFCVNGHERIPENLYYKKNGTADCLVCRRERRK